MSWIELYDIAISAISKYFKIETFHIKISRYVNFLRKSEDMAPVGQTGHGHHPFRCSMQSFVSGHQSDLFIQFLLGSVDLDITYDLQHCLELCQCLAGLSVSEKYFLL